MSLQGVPVIPNDIDIQTDEKGAYEIQELFKAYVTKPVTFCCDTSIKSHFGSITIFDVQPHRQFIKLKGMTIPVLSLKYEESAYRKLGRIKKADLLK